MINLLLGKVGHRNLSNFLIFFFSSVALSSKSEEERRKPSKLAEEKVSERLKPPPDQINFQRKVIRLSDSAKKRINSELDKIVIKNKQTNKEMTNDAISKDESSDPKRLCTSVETNGKQDVVTKNSVVSTTAVKLKRNSLDINTVRNCLYNLKTI